jgi:hypothetical protein
MNKEKLVGYLKEHKVSLMVLLLLIIINIFVWSFKGFTGNTKVTPSAALKSTKVTQKVTSESTLKVTPKTKSTDSDLIINHYYTATIDGKTSKVPLKTTKETKVDDYTVKYTQELDVTKLVKPMLPNWEISTGIGVHDGDTYVPLGIQRNYKSNKALRVTIHFDPKDSMRPNGAEVVHVWKF